MKRRIPSLRHHRPSGRAVVTLNGRDHYCGAFGSPEAKAEYDRLVAQWLAGGRTAMAAGSGLSMAELTVGYLEYCEDYYRSPSTEHGKILHTLRPVVRLFGHTPAAKFGPLSLKAVRQTWIDDGLARSTINQRTGRIVRAFRWASENEIVPAETWYALKAVEGLRAGRSAAKETAPVRPVSDEDFEATLAAIRIPQVVAILRLLRHTGARCGEVCRMRTGEIDRTATTWAYWPHSHKTKHHGHQRVVFIGPRAREVLEPWLRDDPDELLFQPCEAVEAMREAAKQTHRTDADRARAAHNRRTAEARKRGGRATNQRKAGKAYGAASIWHNVARACERAEIPRWHAHQIRHTRGTELRRDEDIESARVVLGHRSLATTEIYAEKDLAAAAAAAERTG